MDDKSGSYAELLIELDASTGHLEACAVCIKETLDQGLLTMPTCEVCEKRDPLLFRV